jgi:hypothetical protein
MAGGGVPTTSKPLIPLTQLLYALLPRRATAGGLGDAARQHQVRDRLIAECGMTGMEVWEAPVAGEAVTGHL